MPKPSIKFLVKLWGNGRRPQSARMITSVDSDLDITFIETIGHSVLTSRYYFGRSQKTSLTPAVRQHDARRATVGHRDRRKAGRSVCTAYTGEMLNYRAIGIAALSTYICIIGARSGAQLTSRTCFLSHYIFVMALAVRVVIFHLAWPPVRCSVDCRSPTSRRTFR